MNEKNAMTEADTNVFDIAKILKILIIEDDANIRELVRWNLSEAGYECVVAADGPAGLVLACAGDCALILLDLMLPGMDGFDLLRALRTRGIRTPVIFLTARDEEADKVIGLEFGADDYVTKPFSVRELKARIKAVLRRYAIPAAARSTRERASADTAAGATANAATDNAAAARDAIVPEGVIQLDDIVIDIPRHEVRVGGRLVELTVKEFALLRTLAQNPGIVFTRYQLLTGVWGYEYEGETRTVDVHVRHLRRKLGIGEDGCLVTVRGVGYKMAVK